MGPAAALAARAAGCSAVVLAVASPELPITGTLLPFPTPNSRDEQVLTPNVKYGSSKPGPKNQNRKFKRFILNLGQKCKIWTKFVIKNLNLGQKRKV